MRHGGQHTLVVTEVNRLIQKRRLLPVDDGPAIFSEQAEFLYSSSHSANWKRLRKLIPDQGLDLEDRMRMVILYLLRHGTAAKTAELVDELAGARFPPEWRQLVPKMCRYSGKGNPGCDSDAFKAANTQLFKTDEVRDAPLGHRSRPLPAPVLCVEVFAVQPPARGRRATAHV